MIELIWEQILPAHIPSMEAAKAQWLKVAKPIHSLGKLEEAVIRMAGMKRSIDFTLDKKALVIMCADNGVVDAGVTQSGQEVTALVADHFTRGATCVNVMSSIAGVDVYPVDIGMSVDVPSVTKAAQKVALGTRNLAIEPALDKSEVEQAIQIGIDMVRQLYRDGYDIIATGEMGIGNTTTSSAVACVLLDREVDLMTGRGAGLDQAGLTRKKAVIEAAIQMHKPDREDPIDVLAKVGGLDIAGLVGVFLGGGIYGIPVVIDGFISSVAALCAWKLVPAVRDYMIPSHVSKEPGGHLLLKELGFSPFLTCEMGLGEGSGAVAVIPLLIMGLSVYRQMSTFEEAGIEQYQEFS